MKNRKGGMGDFIPNLLLAFLHTLFQMVLNAILVFFASYHVLLDNQGSLLLQKICILLNYNIKSIRMVEALSKHDLFITSSRGLSLSSSQAWSR